MTDWVAVAVVAEVAVAPVVVASAFEIVAAAAVFVVVAAVESCSDWLRNIGQPAVVEHSTAGFG